MRHIRTENTLSGVSIRLPDHIRFTKRSTIKVFVSLLFYTEVAVIRVGSSLLSVHSVSNVISRY